MNSIKERLDVARDGLSALFRSHGVRLAYVFGSVARDVERPDSDLDIAVLLGPSFVQDRAFDMTLKLNTEIIGLTHTNDVDVVILDSAPPLLVYEVIAKGRLIFGSHEDRVPFEVEALKRFYDTAPIRVAEEKALFARIDAYPPEYFKRAGTS